MSKKAEPKAKNVVNLNSRVSFKMAEFSLGQYPAWGTVTALSPEFQACYVVWDDGYPAQWVPVEKLRLMAAN